MKLYNGNKESISGDVNFFCFDFEVLFEGACKFTYEEFIEYAINNYGSLKEFFKTVSVSWNDFFGRMDLEAENGDVWFGFMFDIHSGIFSYIENSNYELVDVWETINHRFIM